jgi:hypothetical protein
MTAFGFLLPTREIVMNQDVPNFSQADRSLAIMRRTTKEAT